MENSTKKSGGVEIPKRNRSLDLKSLYKSRVSEVGGSTRKVSQENDQQNLKKKRKRSRKEISLSCFESDAKRIRKGSVNVVKSEEIGSSQKSSGTSKGLHGISISLAENGNAFNFPKRPRGTGGRKKKEIDQVSKSLGLANSGDREGAFNAKVIKPKDEAGTSDELVRLVNVVNDGDSNSKSAGKVGRSNSKTKKKAYSKSTSKVKVSSSNAKLKRKAGTDEPKESRNGRSGSICHAEKENHVAANNGDTSSKKARTNSRKKKDFVDDRDGGEGSKKKSEPSVVSSVSDRLDADFDEDDDDEEKLEQNAARMLSSRFDPSCTGFSSKRKASAYQKANGSSFPISSSRTSVSQQDNSSGGVDSASADENSRADEKSRALRPRREDKGMGVPRKRRHFYEIPPRGLDPHWVLNRRIKVFWPLDESWYYGLVNNYHPECKLHHIKYDDRDEEWVDLQEEKFKLLLFRSEVPGRAKSKRISKVEKDMNKIRKDIHKVETITPEDVNGCKGNDLDSEPIASWLTRSSQLGKPWPKSLKTPRTLCMELPVATSLPSEKTDNLNSKVSDSKRKINTDQESTSTKDLAVHEVFCKSLAGNTNGNHMVYVRKKSQNKGEGNVSLLRYINVYGNALGNVNPVAPITVSLPSTEEVTFGYGLVDSEKHLWSIDRQGKLRLNVRLVEPKKFRIQTCLPVLPFTGFSPSTGDFWLLHDILMVQHGALLSTSPAVTLEMLFIDSYLGLRFFLFEGCMEQALACVFQIMNLFCQANEQMNCNLQSPVTSVRFRLSSVQDLRKHHVYEFHSFSKLHSSKWVCLDSKLLRHCLLLKQLPISECTYDNIKELEYGSLKQCEPQGGLQLSSHKDLNKKFALGILPTGVSKRACTTRISQSALNLAENPEKVPQFALSISTASTFLLTLHLQLLMENCFAWGNLCHQEALCPPESFEKSNRVDAKNSQFGPRSDAVQDVVPEHGIETLDTKAPAFRGLAKKNEDLFTDVVLVNDVVEKVDSSVNIHLGNPNNARSVVSFKEVKEITSEGIAPSPQHEPSLHEQRVLSIPSVVTSISSPASNCGNDSRFGRMVIDIPSCAQVNIPFDGKECLSRQASDVGWCVNEGSAHSPTPTGSRSSGQGSRSSLISSPLGDLSPMIPDASPKFMRRGFTNGPKKPRTQVQYTLPGAGCDFSAKQKTQSQRSPPCRRIRRASLKSTSDGSRGNQKNFDLIVCGANILVTRGDKGWRESGALIVLEVADHNEWILAVKLSGITKYSYKVKNVLQPGTTNRYSHAVLWKGGKDWVLEFTDRSQWNLFKEMHEECYNRNIRAASVKNIPIPGVQFIEESDDYGIDVSFDRSRTRYFRQVQNDVEMAMDPSRILYDMDSDDEQWLMANKRCSDEKRCEQISEEFLERAMDTFEKVSYIKQRDNFTVDEMQENVTGVGSVEAAKVIYEHWREKRGRKGMPLIRHLQPPLWERYQRQLKEWENAVARGNSAISVGIQGKAPIPEKPPMFAFCLKPRGLDVRNKGSKQRSQRKFPVSGHLHTGSGEHHNLIVFGRRSNGHTFGDEKVLYSTHESSDVSPSLQASTRVFSPRDAHFSLITDISESNRNMKVNKSKPKKLGRYPSSHNRQTISYSQRTIGNRKGVQQQNVGLPDFDFEGSRRRLVENMDISYLHELRVREASAAAQRALKTAKLKREKAVRLLNRADLAIQKAAVALMTAEAIKASYESSSGGN